MADLCGSSAIDIIKLATDTADQLFGVVNAKALSHSINTEDWAAPFEPAFSPWWWMAFVLVIILREAICLSTESPLARINTILRCAWSTRKARSPDCGHNTPPVSVRCLTHPAP